LIEEILALNALMAIKERSFVVAGYVIRGGGNI
jgi:hypothetical protein